MTRTSPDARALLAPAATFRDLALDRNGGAWVLARRPLGLLLVMGSAVSILAGGRLTMRLVVDGAISFAFVPLFEIAALAVVVRRRPRRVPFARAVDLLFTASGPWIAWLLALAALSASLTPVELSRWVAAPRLWILAAATATAIVWFVWIEFHVFHAALERSRADAVRDVLLQRALAWAAGTVYFFGFALWPLLVGLLR